jgi:hypothetical protein
MSTVRTDMASGPVIRRALEVVQRTEGVTGYDEVEELRATVVVLLTLVQQLIDGAETS